MKSVSARGIYYNLRDSKYTYNIDDLTFYFSSLFYLNKFKSRLDNFVKYETEKIESMYSCNIKCNYMLYIKLYRNIEKRGFRILYRDQELTYPNFNIILERD